MEVDEGAHGKRPPPPPVNKLYAWYQAYTLEKAVPKLKDNTVARVLLDGKKIGDAGAKAIGAALEHNTSLKELHLNNNEIGDAGAGEIGAVLGHNRSLQVLHLSYGQIGDAGAKVIGEALEHNTSLQELYLYNNQVGDDGAAVIGAALEHNTSLRELHLYNNQVGDDGAVAIGAGLKHNTSLQELRLYNNRIGDSGAAAIGAALEHNTSLKKLNLFGKKHSIGDVGAAALFAGLKHNASLSELNLQYCPIRTLGAEFLWTRRLELCLLDFHKLVWPSPSIASQGRDAIYPFLEAVKERSAPLARSRVMFVGAGGSGKTTLKTALLLRGAGARETLPQLRQSMIETIELKWTEADLQEWVDSDLALERGFFKSCPKAKGLHGGDWLHLSATDMARTFDHPDTATSKRVVSKMLAVLGFLKPEATQTTPTKSWWWWDEMVESLAWSTAALEGVDGTESEVPYGVLLNIPHVWTEGVELDTRWGEYTLWDFPGQMELYPSHRLFLAWETAVYVLVVNARMGKVDDCMRQLRRWLSLIRSGMREGGSKVETRIVVTHTDNLTTDRRNALLRDVHETLLSNYADQFDFGERCYVTLYDKENGGDVDAVRAELVRLRSVLPPNRPLPASYQAICDDVVSLGRKNATWPVVPITAIDWRGRDEAVMSLEDLGFLRRADDRLILEPVTWLSNLMSAFLHPLHGIESRSVPPLPEGATAAALREHHIASTHVDSATACQIVNLRKKVVDAEHESEVLPLLAHFDICFSPLNDGKYVFPSLLPRVTATLPWLARLFEGVMEGRRYVCSGDHDFVPPTVASLLMQRVVAMGHRRGGKPLFFGRGTVVVGCPAKNSIVVSVTDDDRALDIFAWGSDRIAHLSGAAAHFVAVLSRSYQGLRVAKHRLSRLPASALDDAFVDQPYQHPLLGPCQVMPVTTVVRNPPSDMLPEWLVDEYEEALPVIPSWETQDDRSCGRRMAYFLRKANACYTQLLVDPSLVEETYEGMEALAHAAASKPAPSPSGLQYRNTVPSHSDVEVGDPYDCGQCGTSVERTDAYAVSADRSPNGEVCVWRASGVGPPVIFYSIDPSLPADLQPLLADLLKSAGEVWSGVAEIRFAIATADNPPHFVVKMGGEASGVYAKAFFPGDFKAAGGSPREVFVYALLFSISGEDARNRQIDVLAHELGHILGLLHNGQIKPTRGGAPAPAKLFWAPGSQSPDPFSLMYAQVAERDRWSGPTVLSREDVLGARVLYGAATKSDCAGSRAKIEVIRLAVGAEKEAGGDADRTFEGFIVDGKGVPLRVTGPRTLIKYHKTEIGGSSK